MLKSLITLLVICAGLGLEAQPPPPVTQPVVPAQLTTSPPFWNEIADFKHRDSIHYPPAHAILFVGSSTFRKWINVQTDFPGYTIINRGFGGCTLEDVI